MRVMADLTPIIFMMKEENMQTEEKEYAELLCDFMFKRLFGSIANKDVLIWFLNMIIDDAKIEDVKFINTENLGLTKQDRKCVFDISCTCEDGSTLIIEMQKGYQKHFRKRAVYYTTYPINAQGKEARELYIKDHQCKNDGVEFKWDYDLKPVTVVAFLDFKFPHSESWPENRYHSSYRLREDSTNEIMTDVLRFVFLELGRFKKGINEIKTPFEKFMYLLRHMHEMTSVPKVFRTPEFERLFILAEIGNFTPKEYEQYQKSLKVMSDYYNIIDNAVEEAEKRGRAEGVKENKLETAKKMKERGIADDIISECTGLTIETIQSL